MIVKPYITFDGECEEAIALYQRAFNATVVQNAKFKDMPENPDFIIPELYKERVLQCVLMIGDTMIRMSDCGPGGVLNAPESERVSLAIETSVANVKHAYSVLSEEGRAGIPLGETFYSPCTGVVFDQFGVMWNLLGIKEEL